MGEVHIGPREEVRAGQKGKQGNTVRLKRKKRNVKIGQGSAKALVPLAFIFGALSMFVGQAATYHLFAETGLINLDVSGTVIQDYTPFAHFALGGLLALLFAWTFRMMSALRIVALVAGVFVMVQYQGAIIQKVPGVYAAFFSKAYVKEALGQV